MENKKRNIKYILTLMLVIFLVYFFYLSNKPEEVYQAKVFPVSKEYTPFDYLDLKASSVFVYDISEKKKVFGSNDDISLPLASITKLMTTLVAFEDLPEDKEITVSRKSLDEEGDSGLVPYEKWKFKDFIDFMLVTSSNDASKAIALVDQSDQTNQENGGYKSFVNKMNQKANELGFKKMYFLNQSGLDLNKSLSGAYGSAEEVALLISDIVEKYPSLLEATAYDKLRLSSNNYFHIASNTNKYVDKMPSIVASKTGFTDLAGGNLAIVFDAGLGHYVAVVVLGSTLEGRFEDTQKLVWATLEYLNEEDIIATSTKDIVLK